MMGELIREGENGTLSFGNYELAEKGKQSGFEFAGDIYKVKTFRELTRLEKNEIFAYESVPGTEVTGYLETEGGVSFRVRGEGDTQIIIAVEEDTEYGVSVDGEQTEEYDTQLSGKLVLTLRLEKGREREVRISKK